MIKILITLVLLFLVFRKIDFASVRSLIRSADPAFLLPALIAFTASQWVSSHRLLTYFHVYGYRLSPVTNHILYVIGMFYNFFIPGGIGGDAYKVYILNKQRDWEVKKLTLAVLNDRLSGLIAIFLLLQLLLLLILPGNLRGWVFLTTLLTFIVSFWAVRQVFPAFRPVFFRGLGYSLMVQGLQLLCIFFILRSFGEAGNNLLYFAAFLGSSLLSVLSFSGIGVREWLFMKASEVFAFSPQVSVSVALVFSLLTALVSFAGIFFQFRKMDH
ncbi:MAG: flippase-like domain-containing protein [Leadbetterella sp.]|nr:flippase-like domain-containing protein [Leadbetterella sp.]